MRVKRVVSQPINQDNFTKIESLGFNPRGATYWHICHTDGPWMENEDYALIELADGSVFASVYIDDGRYTVPTPIRTADWHG